MSVTHEELFDTIAHKGEYIRKCVIVFNMNDCGFSPKQMERFKFLVGTRLNHKNGYVKFSVRQFTEWEYNYNRAVEMIKETLLEAYRAPQEEELPHISEVIQAERSKKDAKTHTEQSSSA